ncbi:MAG TPA: hypothetical protein VF519_10420 [Mycobacteriales bacterium]|jgi:hypothetical protein
MKRSLSLRREALAELSFAELNAVNGGAQTQAGTTCPLLYCVGLVSDFCYTRPECPPSST